ncbi:MAG: phospholipase, partial [Hyphomicrobiales bacterium]|nr:phospholipase [Hyphomicrobiales bacterium]
MSENAIDDLTALLPALLESLDALAFFSRHFDPTRFDETLASIGAPDAALRDARAALRPWPAHLASLRSRVETASDAALDALAGLRCAPDEADGLRAVMRALRRVPRALDALYPLARNLPPVSRFFLEASSREDDFVRQKLDAARDANGAGLAHIGDKPGARGGFSIYTPEYYDAAQIWPLVFAL